jgi:hypothetical protein
MASDHGKLKPLDGGSALNHESHQNKTPIVVAIGVSSPLRCGSTLYQSLRFASAMMLNLTRRVLKKMRIQMRTDRDREQSTNREQLTDHLASRPQSVT